MKFDTEHRDAIEKGAAEILTLKYQYDVDEARRLDDLETCVDLVLAELRWNEFNDLADSIVEALSSDLDYIKLKHVMSIHMTELVDYLNSTQTTEQYEWELGIYMMGVDIIQLIYNQALGQENDLY